MYIYTVQDNMYTCTYIETGQQHRSRQDELSGAGAGRETGGPKLEPAQGNGSLQGKAAWGVHSQKKSILFGYSKYTRAIR